MAAWIFHFLGMIMYSGMKFSSIYQQNLLYILFIYCSFSFKEEHKQLTQRYKQYVVIA